MLHELCGETFRLILGRTNELPYRSPIFTFEKIFDLLQCLAKIIGTGIAENNGTSEDIDQLICSEAIRLAVAFTRLM